MNVSRTFRWPALAVIALAACSIDDPPNVGPDARVDERPDSSTPDSGPSEPANTGGGEMVAAAGLQGLVVDVRGTRLAGATAQLLGTSVTTDAEGAFSFADLEATDDQVVVVKLDGYSTGRVPFKLVAGETSQVKVVLNATETTMLMDPSQGGMVETESGVSIDLPPGAVIDAEGNPVTEPVEITISLLNDRDEITAAPGGLIALDPARMEMGMSGEEAEAPLESFGMVEVNLTAGGQDVNLSGDVDVELLFPLAPNHPFSDGEAIGLWNFDEEEEVWKQVGEGIVVGENFRANVTHFSWWNADQVMTATCIRGRVLDAAGNPIPAANIQGEGRSYLGSSSATSDAAGSYCMDVRVSSVVELSTVVTVGGAQQALAVNVNTPRSLGSCEMAMDCFEIQDLVAVDNMPLCQPSECPQDPDGLREACCLTDLGPCDFVVNGDCGGSEDGSWDEPPEEPGVEQIPGVPMPPPPEDTDAGVQDAGMDAGMTTIMDAGTDAGTDAGQDAGQDAGADAGGDAGQDAGADAGQDSGTPDAGQQDAGQDAGSSDAGQQDAGQDAGAMTDAGTPPDAGEMDAGATACGDPAPGAASGTATVAGMVGGVDGTALVDGFAKATGFSEEVMGDAGPTTVDWSSLEIRLTPYAQACGYELTGSQYGDTPLALMLRLDRGSTAGPPATPSGTGTFDVTANRTTDGTVHAVIGQIGCCGECVEHSPLDMVTGSVTIDANDGSTVSGSFTFEDMGLGGTISGTFDVPFCEFAGEQAERCCVGGGGGEQDGGTPPDPDGGMGDPDGGTGHTPVDRCGDVMTLPNLDPVMGSTTGSSLLNDWYEHGSCNAYLPGYERVYGVQIPAGETLRARAVGPGMQTLIAEDCADVDGSCQSQGSTASYFNWTPDPQMVFVIVDNTTLDAQEDFDLFLSIDPPSCGDGFVDEGEGETCDDGGNASGDGCSPGCQVEPGWVCPDVCREVVCGDGTVEQYVEQCDDGMPPADGDGCSSSCTVELGYVCETPGEACREVVCGDGIIDDGSSGGSDPRPPDGMEPPPPGADEDAGAPPPPDEDGGVAMPEYLWEQCDDGMPAASGDGCSAECQVEAGWACSGEPSSCEERPAGDLCSNALPLATGQYDLSGLNNDLGYGGGPDLLFEIPVAVGDILMLSGTAAFEGQVVFATDDACSGSMREPSQLMAGVPFDFVYDPSDPNGYGYQSPPDGGGDFMVRVIFAANEPTGDLTLMIDSVQVVTPICGDGLISASIGEECDDGFQVDGDGCDASCQREPGHACPGPGPCRPIVCGDGFLDRESEMDGGDATDPGGDPDADGGMPEPDPAPDPIDEECDDGNTTPGDGCDATCNLEPGWVCDNPNEMCRQVTCNDGIVDWPYEDCEDGNTTPGDGCGSDCKIEAGYLCNWDLSTCEMRGAGDLCNNADALPSGFHQNQYSFSGFTSDNLDCSGCEVTRWFSVVQQAGDITAVIVEPDNGEYVWVDFHELACPRPDDGMPAAGGDAGIGQVAYRYNHTGEARTLWFRIGTDGANTDGGFALTTKTGPVGCGDGINTDAFGSGGGGPEDPPLEPGEECDDMNNDAGDGCSPSCTLEGGAFRCPWEGGPCSPVVCGDGSVDRENDEECDDGGTAPGDGCDASCLVEDGYVCQYTPSQCQMAVPGDVCTTAQPLPLGFSMHMFDNFTGDDQCLTTCARSDAWFSLQLQPREVLSLDVWGSNWGAVQLVGRAGGDCRNLFPLAESYFNGGESQELLYTNDSNQPLDLVAVVISPDDEWGEFFMQAGIGIPAEDCPGGPGGPGGEDAGAPDPGADGGTGECVAVQCNDGVINGTEQCDDMNNMDADGCSSNCVREVGYRCVDSPSSCTTMPEGDACEIASMAPDGLYSLAGYGPDLDGCMNVCGSTRWFRRDLPVGQTLVLQLSTTDIDAGGATAFDMADAPCGFMTESESFFFSIGNPLLRAFVNEEPNTIEALLQVGHEHDPMSMGSFTITTETRPTGCGDYHVDSEGRHGAPEQCDDGNTDDLDGCSSTCQNEL